MNYSLPKTVVPIAMLFSFRMLGLFMLIPVFSVLAVQLSGATPSLIGIALGSYGLSQGILQIPFGLLSDRYGRKRLITIGLTLFAAGSLWGALTHSIYGMIGARIIQGMGAIGSVLIALLADLTADKDRTKAMAILGLTIGTSFIAAMIISPILTHHYGLSSIFYLTFILSLLGLLFLYTIVPTPKHESFHAESETNPRLLQTVLRDPKLQRLNAGIFFQHLVLTATFYVIPMLLKAHIQSGHLGQQWHFYLPVLVCSFIVMLPFIYIAERMKKMRLIFLTAVGLTALCQLLLALTPASMTALSILVFLYFVAFNTLEASLPSLISRLADKTNKGTAMGVYSTSQFLGIFAGGLLSGITYQHLGSSGLFLLNAGYSLIWLFISWPMNMPLTSSR
ncbi:major facilitator family transporter transporter [Legionella birminghamensis]|uniref:Major facilitator family transporter n=1 Tax=Legionella birminghamensis TaxID=28083 RepID=A0A378IDG6_9GAMM|nr:major facilitator family transporter transporter [Legionella birminghamensis]STX32996.1 major facilitator family transporter [Legionella birminghamensis]